jgi:hypothetical protein
VGTLQRAAVVDLRLLCKLVHFRKVDGTVREVPGVLSAPHCAYSGDQLPNLVRLSLKDLWDVVDDWEFQYGYRLAG